MLDTLRNSANTWVVKILMGLLVISFAVWGIADIFGGYSSDSVAKVGKEKITLAQYQREIENETKQFSQRLGTPLSREQARALGVERSALSRLIGLAALNAGTARMGLAVSDEAVARNIANDPSLAGASGHFDRAAFQQALARAEISEKAFIADRRNFLLRKQIADVIEAGVVTPPDLLDALSIYQNETRVASYLILPPGAAGDIPDPDEKTLEDYHKKAAIHFTRPETRDFSILVLTPKDVAATLTISDDDLKTAYEQRRAEFDKPEKRQIQQIPFATLDAANAAAEKLKKGESLETIVSGLGLSMDDIALGTVSRAQMLSPVLADAAFALKTGEYSAPVQGPLGPVILHVEKIEPAEMSTFDGVKDKLREIMASDLARNEVYNIQNNIEDARAGGASLEDIAARNNLKLQHFIGVTQKGLTLDDKKPDGLPDYPELVETAFRSEPGEDVLPADTGDGGYYWLRVDAVKPAEVKPLDKVRAEVVALWKQEKRKADLDTLAQSLVERGNKGESFDKIAASVGRAVLDSPSIRRTAQSDTFSRIAVTRLFAAPKGGFTYGPVGFGDSILVMQVKTVSDPKPDRQSAEYQKLHTEILDSLQGDMITTFVMGLQNELGVEINTPLLQRLASSDNNL
jgi:peptidyl-prolyl cis-trans isomerase D